MLSVRLASFGAMPPINLWVAVGYTAVVGVEAADASDTVPRAWNDVLKVQTSFMAPIGKERAMGVFILYSGVGPPQAICGAFFRDRFSKTGVSAGCRIARR
ncbi:hypothetical protein SAMN02982917_6998 [Azospirillum oryzae]|uniref:Uncharacterized protein n=2 Tax=Azospirillum oryzae TaxID=286727 RepID=A0A1X7HPB5_9PROT|nr:hypothetical protein SAMN02982917_6998 [Azospirillum oryzae]